MDSATVSRIEAWETRPTTGGYRGLHELADAEFTGAVSAGRTWLFVLNGKVVGVVDGDISAAEGADLTAYEAPHPALPLLFAMLERDGEVRGQYYTDDTPIEEVDQTLTEGGFTGYLELSENVLSGDYYVAYYGGRSLAAAFVGNEGRVETGEEAYRLATDEVGIYEVRSVDIDVADIPEPSDEAAAAGAAAGGSTGGEAPDEEPTPEDAGAPTEREAAEAEGADADEVSDSAAPEPADAPGDDAGVVAEAEPTDEPASAIEDAEAESTTAEAGGQATGSVDEGGPDTDAVVDEAESTSEVETSAPRDAESGTGGQGAPDDVDVPSEQGEPEERFKEEERWRETRTVPALDPDESEAVDGGQRVRERESRAPAEPEPEPEPEPARQRPDPEVERFKERIDSLESELQSRERDRQELVERVEELTDERQELYAEREALEERLEELESRLEAAAEAGGGTAESGAGGGGGGGETPPAGQSLDRQTALDRTDLFVRYSSKGAATLQDAHDGEANRESVSGNLRLETHSRFERESTTVDGRPFDEFLVDTIEYRFVSWLVEDLLYEIAETGSQRGLKQLFDAIPQVDRAEFHGTVTGLDEEDEEREESFDVVCRNRMGQPLIVANINDSLDPATGDMMIELVEDASAAGEGNETVAAGFLVTASFFQPEALETASEATGGGFLSRDSKKSFVKLSRKGGYHLCLVEARGDDFHVAVPEM